MRDPGRMRTGVVEYRDPRPGAPAGGGGRLAYPVPEAAALLGIGETAFREYVLPHLRLVYVGRKPVVPRAELERFLEREAREPLAGELRALRAR